jgi:hypothetical protein
METLKKIKKSVINIPIKISLTNKGVNFLFKHNKKINPIRMVNNELVYGVLYNNISYEYLRKIIRADFVSSIEIGQSELLTYRDEIIDLSKFIFYEFLYFQFSKTIFDEIINTEFIKKWNRNNPGKIIDEKTKINQILLKTKISIKKDEILNLKNNILNDINTYYKVQKISNEDIDLNLKTCETFLDSIQNFTWYIILQSKLSNEFNYILNKIKKLTIDYIEKCIIADYLSLVIIELISDSENVKLLKYFQKKDRKKNYNSILSDKEIRNNIFKQLEEKKDFLFLTFKIKNNDNSFGLDKTLQILLVNQAYEYRNIKYHVETKLRNEEKDINIFEFYKNLSKDYIDNKTGLYYLLYLKEACFKKDIKFKSNVSQLLNEDIPILSLSLKIK